MMVKILLPSEVFFEGEAAKVNAEAANGSFCLLPRHIDFVTALVPGLMTIEDEKGAKTLLAIDEGILVKKDFEVLISTRNAVLIPEMGKGRQIVQEQFNVLDDREKASRSAAARLEADMVRRLMELK